MKYISSILLLITCMFSFGQNIPQDTAAVDPTPWKPSFVRIGYDISRPGISLFSPGRFSQEGSIEIDFKDLFLVSEFGYEESSQSTPGYSNSGFYYRVGVDANMIRYDQSKNVITFGLRYASANFQHEFNTTFTDDFGTRDINEKETGVTASWFEVLMGMKVRVWRQLFMGYGFRLKFANSVKEDGAILPFEMPGYGRVFNDGREKRGLVLGFHYAFYWTIKLRDKPVPVRKFKPRKQFNSPPAGNSNNLGNSLRGIRN
ncbi:MAG: DUF6048 family protein [Cytophagales bacterium]|nr:DUF6048 family protein [Cytophagales bacterium]